MRPWKVQLSGEAVAQAAEERRLIRDFLDRREERAFRTLYRRFTPSLYRVACQMIGSRNGDAEEVVQIAWTRALERLEGFRFESSLLSWLTGITINCCREARRARARGAASAEVEPDELPDVPPVARPIQRHELERALASLPEGYREVLILHDVEGYTHEEIGRLLAIETGTSKSQLCRARRALRARLGVERNGSR